MAQSPPSQDDYDPIRNIRQWQLQQQTFQLSSDADEAFQHNEISRLSASLLTLFKEVILSLREEATIPKDVRISLERSCSAMILWSDGYGIAQGNLNDVFKRSSKLRRTLFTNLSHLGHVLMERLIPLANLSSEKLQELCSGVVSDIEDGNDIANEELYQKSAGSSSDAESIFSDDNIYEVAEDLRTDTHVLSSLDSLIKYPVFDLDKGKAVEAYVQSTLSPEKFFVDKIENQFPFADVSLVSRLGRTNYERYLRCQADREAHEIKESGEGLPSTVQEAPETTGTIITGSAFHDSGVGTSIMPTITYPETLMSRNHNSKALRIPPLSKDAKKGLPFSCVACGRTVVIIDHSAWKRHLFLDLQPYMCLYVSCSYGNTTFENRESWISHLALEHDLEPKWDSMKCFLCREQTGSGKSAITRHFSKHLEEISLSALPVEIYSDAIPEEGSELYDSDDDNKNPLGAQDKGKSRAIPDNAPAHKKHNSPCNIVYARNLPTKFEEEIRSAFSKQQGYKGYTMMQTRIATMWCFFEFENTFSATRAYHNLDGELLNESIKGGISLKFFNKHPDNPVLPRGWIAEYDEDSQRWFFCNPGAGLTRWEVPLVNPPYNPPSHLPPLPPGWRAYFNDYEQRWAYNNWETGMHQGEFPLVNPPFNPPSYAPPIPPGWIPYFDYRWQRWFYVNKEIGVFQWENPGGHDGRPEPLSSHWSRGDSGSFQNPSLTALGHSSSTPSGTTSGIIHPTSHDDHLEPPADHGGPSGS
ncbi:hypothetical protein ACQKWADRAFT_282899 [Trichoderma austrokoningii]